MKSPAPPPQTLRLEFTQPTPADFPDSAAMWGDEATTRHIGGRPSTPEESWSRLLRTAGHWAWLGYGFWVVRDRRSGRFVGEFGFKQFRRGLDPTLEWLPEAGWVLAPWARRQGFGAEAAAAILAWADAHTDWPETCCMIDPGNAASLRVAASGGYLEHGRAFYQDKPVILLRRAAGRREAVSAGTYMR